MNNRHSRSALFLMEQLIVVAVFAVCAAACVKILTQSYFMASDTRDTSNALHAAESSAECYKAVSGDMGEMAKIMGGQAVAVDGRESVAVYYDKTWVVCGEENAAYRLLMVSKAPESGAQAVSYGDLSVEKLGGKVLIELTVAAQRNGRLANAPEGVRA